MQTEDLSKKLRILRENCGLSQGQVANKLFISRAAYSHYETGKRIPNIENIMQLSSIYNINPIELFKTLIQKKSNIPSDIPDFNEQDNYFKVSNKTYEFMNTFNKLTSTEQDLIISMTNLLSNKHHI